MCNCEFSVLQRKYALQQRQLRLLHKRVHKVGLVPSHVHSDVCAWADVDLSCDCSDGRQMIAAFRFMSGRIRLLVQICAGCVHSSSLTLQVSPFALRMSCARLQLARLPASVSGLCRSRGSRITNCARNAGVPVQFYTLIILILKD